MDFSTTPLSYLLLLTLSAAVTLLSAEGQFPNSPTPALDACVCVTIRPRSTATPDAGATITGPEDVVTTAPSVDVTAGHPSEPTSTTVVAPGAEMVTAPNVTTTTTTTTTTIADPSVDVTTEPPSTTSTQPPPSTTSTPSTAAPVITELPFPNATPLKLVCPSSTPDKFLSTSWFLLTPKEMMVGLYRIDEQGVVSRYKDRYNLLSGINVSHNVTSDTCNHTATYQCRRSARVGYTNEVHSFSVANCTVSRKVDRRSNSNDNKAVALGNTSTRLISWSLILAIGPTVQFMSIY